VGGEIQLAITLQPEQEQLSIHIKDNGIGIAPENIGKLFQPFVQLDSSLTRRFSGTGLGLALVRRIAELHEGSVSVISKLGEGSKFSIHLPWSPSSQLPSQTIQNQTLIKLGEESVHNQHNSLQQEQPVILIADDDDDNIETMWDYLLSQGYRLIRAKHGQEALEFVAQSPPDLILMDIQMPEMDGFTAIARLRETFTKEDLPIIALTALAMDGDRQRCLDAGANIYLSKPFRLKTLVQEIRQLLTPPN
jgi:CheY-like chemotaxis protein